MRMSTGHLLGHLLASSFSLLVLTLLVVPDVQAQGRPDIFNLEVAAEDPGAGDLFACAMSLSRQGTLVVGSVLDDDRGTDSGSLYVFQRQGGAFQETAKLLASDGAPEHRLGFSVSVDPGGTRFAAGAIFHDAAGQNAGAAYVFRREGGTWIQEARLIPVALGPFDQLGHSVALSGDALAAGAPGDDTRADAAGTVYMYRRVGNDWALDAMLTAGQGQNVGDGLGFAVALDGTTLLAGAPFADDGLGAVLVFQLTIEGWQEVQRITAPQRRDGALFGAAVAIDGDRAVIGARLDDGIADRAGAAWTFRRVNGVWEVEQPLPAPSLAAGDELGISVALDGDALAVGARFDDDGANGQDATDSGAVYRYRLRGTVWTFEQKLKAAEPAMGDELGFAVAIEDIEDDTDDFVVAGAYRADSEAGPDSGLARLRVEARNADLAITKSDGRASAATGDTLVYTITASNLGPADVVGARVTDTFPAGLTCDGDIDEVLDLPAGASVTFTATCTVTAAVGATITNRARVELPEEVEDPDLDDNEAVDVTRVTEDPVFSLLTISKTAPVTVPAGGTLPYTVTVTSQGPGPAQGVRVTDPFPVLLLDPLVCTWSCAGASCATSGPVTGDIDDTVDLPVGASVTYSASCAVPCSASGSLGNVATAVGSFNRVAASVGTTVTTADLDVEVLVEPSDLPSSTVRVVVENRGTAPVVDAVLDLSRTPMAGFTEITDLCDGTFPCALGTLDPGEIRQIDLQATSECGDPVTEVELVATASSAGACPMTARDTATLALQPATDCPVNLRILKGTPSTVVTQGSPVLFNVQVINDGPETAVDARVQDLLPPGLNGASLDDLVTLPPGGTVSFSVQATVDVNACGTITNTAFVTASPPNVDTQPTDNSASASIFAVPANGTCAIKTAAPKAQLEGGEIVFTVLLIHGGPGALGGPGNEFEDTVPAGLTVTAVSADQGIASFIGNFVSWDGTLDPGESVTITITTTVDPGTLEQILCNQGEVVPNQTLTDDPEEPGNEDPTCVFIVATIPTLSPALLAVMALLVAALGVIGLARRRPAPKKAKNR